MIVIFIKKENRPLSRLTFLTTKIVSEMVLFCNTFSMESFSSILNIPRVLNLKNYHFFHGAPCKVALLVIALLIIRIKNNLQLFIYHYTTLMSKTGSYITHCVKSGYGKLFYFSYNGNIAVYAGRFNRG